MITETLNISGMTCNHCVKSVEEAMKSLQVEKYEVKIGSLYVEYDPAKVTNAQIVKTIEDNGYEIINKI